MSNWSNIFESFYTRFILRDAVAKVTPGLGLAIGIATLFETPTTIFTWFRDLPAPLWLLVLGFAWLLGFAIQSFAELPVWRIYVKSLSNYKWVGLLWYWPPGLSESDWSKVLVGSRNLFETKKYIGHATRFERFDVIKEACGISYVTVLLLLIIHAAALGIATNKPPTTISLLQFLFALSISILLQRMHIKNVWRQYLYARDLLVKDIEVQGKVDGLREVLIKNIVEPQHSLWIFGGTTLLLIVLAYLMGAIAGIMGIIHYEYPICR